MKMAASSLFKFIVFFTFSYIFGKFFNLSFGVSNKNLLPVAVVATLLFVFLVPRRSFNSFRLPNFAFWVVCVAFAFPFVVLKVTLKSNDLEPIIIFFRDTGWDEVFAIGRGSLSGKIDKYVFMLLALLASSYLVSRWGPKTHRILTVASLLFLLANPISIYIYRIFIPDPLLSTFVIEDHFSSPEIIAKPEEQKNLILIYLESVEQTYEELPETADEFATVHPLYDTSWRARGIKQISGTTYTIAGFVATHCGVPLVPYGLNNGLYARRWAGLEVSTFMPNVHCLGDQLSDDGYTLSYMNGADASKYSKRAFFTEHGYTRIFDLNSVDPETLVGRNNEWGMNDEVLFENVREEIAYLEELDAPYVLSYLTISTHGPDAYLDTTCASEEEVQIPDAIRCSFEQLIELRRDLEAAGHLEDTIIVVMSDHLARQTSLEESLRDADGRFNLFFVLGGPDQAEIDRVATPLDIYPTLLEIMGYSIAEGRANFGVSLTSPTQNLVEFFGTSPEVSKRFRQNHALGEFLWDSNRE